MSDVQTPPTPAFANADFLAALQSLMPRGAVWPRDPGAIQTKTLAGLAPTHTRLALAAGALIADAFPATTVGLIDEWEASLGLPDPCIGPNPLLSVRQGQVVARFAGGGGQSVTYFIGLAALLGYTITIDEFTGADAHKWRVNVPGVITSYFRVGSSSVGEPLITGIDPTALECLFNELKPSHTVVEFNLI